MRKRIAIIVAATVVASTMLMVPAAQAASCKDAKNVERCCAKKTDTKQRENRCIERNTGT